LVIERILAAKRAVIRAEWVVLVAVRVVLVRRMGCLKSYMGCPVVASAGVTVRASTMAAV
jgi:hypothetical protein